jgi:hypothetical protein
VIGIKDEKNPFHEPIKKAFQNHYQKNPDQGQVEDVEDLIKSRKIFAVPCHYYQKRDP